MKASALVIGLIVATQIAMAGASGPAGTGPGLLPVASDIETTSALSAIVATPLGEADPAALTPVVGAPSSVQLALLPRIVVEVVTSTGHHSVYVSDHAEATFELEHLDPLWDGPLLPQMIEQSSGVAGISFTTECAGQGADCVLTSATLSVTTKPGEHGNVRLAPPASTGVTGQ